MTPLIPPHDPRSMETDLPYPQWKLVAWRFFRVFMVTFGVTFLSSIGDDFSFVTLKSLFFAALAASISATAKYIRQWAKEQDYQLWLDFVRKIPI